MKPGFSMFKTFFLILVALSAAHARTAMHFSYTGNDPSRWTRSALSSRDSATATDFSVFPCGAASCTVNRMLTDAAGNTYVTGSRDFGSATSTSTDVFVAKLDPAGTTVFLATFSGKGRDSGSAFGLDAAGNIYLGGSTTSPNFPLRNPLVSAPVGSWTGFLLKLSPDGSQLIYSTYFAGTVAALAVDSAGNVYATGQTASSDFPATPGMPNGIVTGFRAVGGVLGAYVAKVSPAGDKIVYAGRISGSAVACGAGSSCFLSMRQIWGVAIALDAAGNAYVAGGSNVTDLPTTPGVLSPTGIGGWVARVKAAGTGLDYLTYIGAANYVLAPYANPGNVVSDLSVDAAGNAYVVGRTNDPKFPATAGAYQSKYNGPAQPDPYPTPPTDAFVAKLNPQGTAMVWATFLGGSADDVATAIAIDTKGAAYVTGTTLSTDFPLTAGPQQGADFIAALSPDGAALSFSARFPGTTVSHAIAVDASGRLRVTGSGGVVNALTLAQPVPPRILGIADITGGAFAANVAPGEMITLVGASLGPAAGVSGSLTNPPDTLGGTQVQFDGVAVPLLYVAASQINAIAPASLTVGKTTGVRVVTSGSPSITFQAPVVAFEPQIFRNGNDAAALNQDGTVNSYSNPAKFGSIVAIWATGTPSGLYVAGKPAQVLYAGPAPGPPGIYQINFLVPSDVSQYGNTESIGFTSAPSGINIYVAP